MAPVIEIMIEAGGWDALGDIETLTRRAVETCVEMADAEVDEEEELSLLLCDDARIRELNRDFRGLDKPTNVLSFPAPEQVGSLALGDIAIAFETVAREAAEEGKSLADHYSHMVVHGLLHILGYDHEMDDEAEIMEALERAILGRMGIADPYASAGGDPATP